MKISLNVLNHLGLKLYSNTAAVLSEIVANAWDADAEHVEITIDKQRRRLTILDDGHGMTRDDVNERFLNIGYRRRDLPGGGKTPKHKRPVMGRKGIGKLSLFSVAGTIDVQTIKNGEKSALRLELHEIERLIKAGGELLYEPKVLPASSVDFDKGTRIVLTKLKRAPTQVQRGLRKRISRRFSVLGSGNKFEVKIDGKTVSPEDRDYFHKLQYVWWYGDAKSKYGPLCTGLEKEQVRSGAIEGGYEITGWIGTVANSGALKDSSGDGLPDNLNRIIVLTRGKLAQEDMLEEFAEGGIYTKYLMGEINAPFLDQDELEDIATSSRQRFIEEDERYLALEAFLRTELKNVENIWTTWRNEQAVDRAIKIPAIREWLESLPKDQRKKAESLFGRINRIPLDNEADRSALFQHTVLAFESLRYRDRLDQFDQVLEMNLDAFIAAVANLDDIEASLYHRIVSERIRVVQSLRAVVEEAELEKVVQKLLFNHLWLLDASWERATETTYMEETVAKRFKEITAKLSPKERKGRVDIGYKKMGGANVIVELKRSDRVVDTNELIAQVSKYRTALRKILDAAGKHNEPIETICLVGRPLKDWAETNGREESRKMLDAKNTRVVQYQQMIEEAYQTYDAFLKSAEEIGRVQKLLQAIEQPLLAETSNQ